MKKKILLIASVIIVCVGLLGVSKIVQDKYLNENTALTQQKDNDNTPKEDKVKEEDKIEQEAKEEIAKAEIVKEEVKPTSQPAKTKVESSIAKEQNITVDSKTEVSTTNTQSTEKAKVVTKAEPIKAPEPKAEPNFIIKDDISGKVILSINVSTENKTAGEVTFSELARSGISYKASGRGDAVYFTMINGLKARDFGPLSGWCYYVNGVKSSISSGAYKLKESDVVQWRYLEDGVNN